MQNLYTIHKHFDTRAVLVAHVLAGFGYMQVNSLSGKRRNALSNTVCNKTNKMCLSSKFLEQKLLSQFKLASYKTILL